MLKEKTVKTSSNKASIIPYWGNKKGSEIHFKYNPKELSFDKSVQIAEINIPGLDSPLQQFVRGNSEKLTLELFFDTTDEGTGKKATPVTTRTDPIYKLTKIDPDTHAPPHCIFKWGSSFPGSSLMDKKQNGSSPKKKDKTGNQSREGFHCVVESVKQKFTLFNPDGVPLRATLTVVLREYKPLNLQLSEINKNSPNRTHSHIVERGENLSDLAARYYRLPGEWRPIATENEIEDPRRLESGLFLRVPPIE